MDESRGRVFLKQSVVPTIAHDKSVEEDLSNDLNKSNKKVQTSVG